MSSGCGDVLSLADLQTAKKHQIFEAEVITGKSGGVASGADIDYATNQVTGQTQKTLPAVLRHAGFSAVSWDFSTGGTLAVNDRDKVVYDPVSKTWYSYAGTLPVTVPASFNPVGNADWKPQTDPYLRDDLSAQDGLTLIGSVPDVSTLAAVGASEGDSIILDSYAGSNLGGGIMVAVSADTAIDNIVTFPGNGVVWKRKFFNGTVDVYDAGYTGTEDLAVFINKINAAGFDCVVPVSGEITTPIIFDIAKGALIGKNKCTLTESASATGDYYLTIVNTDTDYTNRDVINATALMTGVSFVGKGTRKLAIGGSTSGEVSELRISNCGFISTAGIEFLDNAYRILFDKCTLSRSFTNSVIFNSPANSGEVIKFNHCWMVDNGGPFKFVNGQFIFDSCSLPSGKKSGYFDPAVELSDNATVVFTNGNIEYQPGQSFVGFTVAGSSRLSIKDSTVLLPSDYASAPIVCNGDGVVSLSNCSLPLYGSTSIATGFPTRQLVGGMSKKVMSRGCYPRAGFIPSNWNLGAIVSPYINSLSNGSAQFLSTSNWTLSQTGTGTVTVSVNNDVPNTQMFTTAFSVTTPTSSASANFTQTCEDCEPGRYFQFGFWAKGLVPVLASIRFLDKSGNAVASSSGYSIPQSSTYAFFAFVDTVPAGALTAEINFAIGGSAGSFSLHNVIYGLI